MAHHADDLFTDEAPVAVRELLRRAAEPATVDPSTPLLAAMAAEARSTYGTTPTEGPRRSMVARIVSAKVAAAGVVVALSATGAAAATGSLPQAAQDRIADAAHHVGLDLPSSADDRVPHTTADDAESQDVGNDVSTVATDEHPNGVDRGAAVSDEAGGQGTEARNDGQPPSQSAGEPAVSTPNHGDAGTPDGNPASDNAPVETPNDGGAADDAPAGPPAEPPRPAEQGDPRSDRTVDDERPDPGVAPAATQRP